MERLFNENILIYAMIGIFGVGMLLNLLLSIGYSRMIRASKNMGKTKNKLLRELKLKFEAVYKLKINVNNVDAFVDKCLNNHKTWGIMLITWEKTCGQLTFLSGLLSITSVLLGIIIGIEGLWILSVFSVGFVLTGMLISFGVLLNKKKKREIIRSNVIDYIENYLINRLEQEKNNPDLLSEYEGYFSEYGINDLVYGQVAAGNEELQIEFDEVIDFVNKKPTLVDKWFSAKEKRRRKREAKKATKIFKKQTEKAARTKRRDDKKKKRLEANRKAKREKLQKHEEKLRQVEIKKALELEKQENSSRKKANKITPAERNKESLKKEIEELRILESRSNEQEADRDMDIVDKAERVDKPIDNSNVINIEEMAIKDKADNSVYEEKKYIEDSKREVASTSEHNPLENKREFKELSSKDNNGPTSKQIKLTKQEKQIIKDVLREYLG